MLKKFKGEDIETISPTLGFDIQTFDFRGYKLNVWDVGGQKTIRSYWRNYFEQTDGIVWVVDSADKRRLQQCKDELSKILNEIFANNFLTFGEYKKTIFFLFFVIFFSEIIIFAPFLIALSI